MKHPLIISYYTPDTNYEAHALKMRASAERLGLETLIEPRPARPSWVENCAQKALFIQEVWLQVNRPVLWVDADAVIYRPMTQLIGCDADFAVVRRNCWEFLGSQIYFGTSPNAGEFISRWCDYCSTFPHIWDQVSLGYTWWDMELEKKLKPLWLDDSLAAILSFKKESSYIRNYSQKLQYFTNKRAESQRNARKCLFIRNFAMTCFQIGGGWLPWRIVYSGWTMHSALSLESVNNDLALSISRNIN